MPTHARRPEFNVFNITAPGIMRETEWGLIRFHAYRRWSIGLTQVELIYARA